MNSGLNFRLGRQPTRIRRAVVLSVIAWFRESSASSKRRGSPLSGYWSFACSALACFRTGMSGRLLGQTDFAHQFGVTRIGAQGIERVVSREGDQPGVVLLVCRIKPLEGMILVAQIGI